VVLARAIEDSDRETKRRRIEESRLAHAPASTPSTSSSSSSRAPPEKRKSEEAAAAPAKQQKVVTFEAPESRKRDRDGDEEEEGRPTRYQATMEQTEPVALLNKAKYQELMKAKHEHAKNIMQKDPDSGKVWNICTKKSREAAVEFLRKFKPKMLHLELFEGLKTEIALGLAEVQRHAGRKFVLEGHLQSSSWNVPAAKKLLKMQETHQAVLNSHVEGGPR
jgi:hypothetical protein